jgi:CheY-like chemotaxis protein
MDTRRVLLVEDSRNDAFLHRRMLLKDGGAAGVAFEVVHAENFTRALQCLSDGAAPFDLVLLDLGLPDGDGLGSIGILRQRFPAVPVAILSGLDDPEVAQDALAHGATAYLLKGTMGPDALARALLAAMRAAAPDAR